LAGSVAGRILTHAQADVLVVSFPQEVRPIRKILLPTAGGPHAQYAEHLAGFLATTHQGSVTLLRVNRPDLGEEQTRVASLELEAYRTRLQESCTVETLVIEEADVGKAILEASEDCDLLVLGAGRGSAARQELFSSVHEHLAANAKVPLMIMRRYLPREALVGRVLRG
jgi:nucleotide-binding universal stress UspA family protein